MVEEELASRLAVEGGGLGSHWRDLSRLQLNGKGLRHERERWKMGAKLTESCLQRESGFAFGQGSLGNRAQGRESAVERECFLAEVSALSYWLLFSC